MPDDELDISRHLRKVQVKRPSDMIIEQISNLIARGLLKSGDKLPSERLLAERFEVGRGVVREALRRLEFYGIVKTLPQSGTVIEKMSELVLVGLIANILNMDDISPDMLIEVRGALEVLAARLASERATPAQIEEIRRAHARMEEQVEKGGFTLEEDLLFHLKLAEASNNVLLRSLITLIGPDVLRFSHQHATYRNGRRHEAQKEHARILAAIEGHEADTASGEMESHISKSYAQFNHPLAEFVPAAAAAADDDAIEAPKKTPVRRGRKSS